MVEDRYSVLKRIKEEALANKVPIMEEESLDYLTTFLIKHQIKKILEIGTAVGYSAIRMAVTDKEIEITTIERDEKRYLEAVKNVKKMGLEDRITIIFKDALTVKLEDTFELIFIDAAKGQNIKFFELFEKNLQSQGFIITDNIYFHGLVFKNEKEISSRNVRGIVRKINNYLAFLKNNEQYETKILPVGDGLSVSQKKT